MESSSLSRTSELASVPLRWDDEWELIGYRIDAV
jgi:hypothetical protein